MVRFPGRLAVTDDETGDSGGAPADVQGGDGVGVFHLISSGRARYLFAGIEEHPYAGGPDGMPGSNKTPTGIDR